MKPARRLNFTGEKAREVLGGLIARHPYPSVVRLPNGQILHRPLTMQGDRNALIAEGIRQGWIS